LWINSVGSHWHILITSYIFGLIKLFIDLFLDLFLTKFLDILAKSSLHVRRYSTFYSKKKKQQFLNILTKIFKCYISLFVLRLRKLETLFLRTINIHATTITFRKTYIDSIHHSAIWSTFLCEAHSWNLYAVASVLMKLTISISHAEIYRSFE